MATLESILLDSAYYLDLDTEEPSGTDLTSRIRFANMAVQEWANAYKWRQLRTELVPTLGSFASLALPNYQYLDGPPMEAISTATYYQYPEIAPTDRFNKDSDEKYCYVTGNDSAGWAIHFNGINLNASLTIPYIRAASGMATLTDICEVPDPQFVTNRIISYVLQARNDERFPIVLADGNRLLRNMVTTENIQLPGGVNSTPKKGVAAYSLGS